MAETLKEFEQENPLETTKEVSEETVTQPTPEGEKVVEKPKEDRPVKNWEAEVKRKDEENEKLREELELTKTQPISQQPTQPDWRGQVEQMATNEMTTTGSSMPWQTIMQVTDNLIQRNSQRTTGVRDQSDKELRGFMRSARKSPDFISIEDDFLDLVDQLQPNQVNKQTLEVCLNSVRGKNIDKLIKQAEERARKSVEKDTEIVGPTDTGTSTVASESVSLSVEQQKELDGLNFESSIVYDAKDYSKMLDVKRANFKVNGAKNVPQTLNDSMIK